MVNGFSIGLLWLWNVKEKFSLLRMFFSPVTWPNKLKERGDALLVGQDRMLRIA